MSDVPRNQSKANTAIKFVYLLPVLFVLGVCIYLVWNRASHRPPPSHTISSKPFLSQGIGGLTANFFTDGSHLRPIGNDVFIEFRNAQSNLVDVGDVSLILALTMPGTVMHSIGKINRTGTPGQYRTTIEPQVGGTWNASLSYSGPHGKAETNFSLVIK